MNSSPYSATRRSTVVVLTTVAVFACAMMAVQHQRKQTPGPAVASRTRPPQIQSCVDCHDIAKQFDSVPHAQTLRSPGVSVLQKQFSGQSFKAGDRSSTYRFFEEDDGSLWCENDSYPQAVSVDWLLGSGRHAITPVSTWTNSAGQTELLELAVSWYPEQGLGLTLGQSAETLQDAIGIDRLGKRLSHGESLECLGCHSTWLPLDEGRIRFHEVDPGVTCNRCHTGAARHVETEGNATPPGFSWEKLTPLESVNRCGICHRRADQMTSEELTVDNQLLVRFASAAIVQSPCFLKQEVPDDSSKVRLDCLTCHDPHRPASNDPVFYSDRCRTCHGGASHKESRCPDMTSDSNCLPCHMPKVEIHPNLSFTDHWIRIRDLDLTRTR
jgi:hypothetical protein